MYLCVYIISWTWSSRRTTCEGSSRSWETMRTSNSPLPSSPTSPRESWWRPLSLVVTSLDTWTTREDSCRRTWPGLAPMPSLTCCSIHNFVHGDLHPGNILVQDTHQPRLVLLDCGIATSLTPFDLLQMRALFTAIVKGDGVQVADLMLVLPALPHSGGVPQEHG
ncbi:Uncharacterized aarF domain-containing protein kinase 2 [Geodia barretti]|uniref:Uncharacterized aarF domain-containing protein kinase 2 n=1 Tax=Geodia barretti TaxID=519541 RepID=A0AA35TLA7_GEOBA|nr:Uncharacterized aarF domain-containing protein kinase 2 [Geodia barretti]